MAEQWTRREVLAGVAAAALGTQASGAAEPAAKIQLCIFSKHLQFAGWKEAAELAAGMGFEGVDLTVRAGGHVLPERVEQDLPKAVEAVKQAGLTVPMITAGIVDTSSPHAEAILRTASALGIRYYRWGGFRYSYDRPIAEQLQELKPRVAALAELNQKHGMCAMYHTHSGPGQVGASIWDLWLLLKDHDPRWVSVNYDIGHARAEGGYGGWLNTAHLVRTHMRGVALKDYTWAKSAKGEWAPQWCPAGDGLVNFTRFFSILKAANFAGPVQFHYEYKALGGADTGAPKLTLPREQVLAAMKKDLDYLKGLMKQAGLA